MKNDYVKLKVIKDTVVNSIISDLDDKLSSKMTDEKKRAEIIRFTHSRLQDIMKALDHDLMPKRELASQVEFEEHILKTIRQVKRRLEDELKKEFSIES